MRDRAGQKGLTLIELLVTVAIITASFAVIVGGLGTAILGSDVQRRQVTADAIVRTTADTILSDTVAYVPCASSYALSGADPDGYTRDPVVVLGHWNAEFNRFEPAAACISDDDDDGLQLIELSVTSNNRSVTEKVRIVKRDT